MAKDVVLIGAGHAHLEVLRRLCRRPAPGARLTLIARSPHTVYTGMLPGVVAGIYAPGEAEIDAAGVATSAGARFLAGEVTGIDLRARRVQVRERPPVPYDLLSVNVGSVADARGIDGVAQHAIPARPAERLLAGLQDRRRRILDAGLGASVGVVGGGAGGVELILALQRRIERDAAERGLDPSRMSFTLITASDGILPTFPPRLRERCAALMRERNIRIIDRARVTRVLADGVVAAGLGHIRLDAVIWCTGAAPAPWLAGTGLALDADGFIEVSGALQSVSHPEVLAAGDIASVRGARRPKAGVHAVRAGPLLAANLARLLQGRSPLARTPQRAALALISTGERYALGTRGGVTVEGAWVWRLKDCIDRRYVARFHALAAAGPARA